MTFFVNGKPIVAAMITMVLVACCTTGAAFAGYIDEVLADHPITYWRLGEDSGTVASDLGSFGVDSTYVNVTLGEPSLIASDPDNTAARFDGHSSVVAIPARWDADLSSTVNERSIVLWFKADDVDRKVTDYRCWYLPGCCSLLPPVR